jgi:hypothetical protein
MAGASYWRDMFIISLWRVVKLKEDIIPMLWPTIP